MKKKMKLMLEELGALLDIDRNVRGTLLVEVFTCMTRMNLCDFKNGDSRAIFLYGCEIDHVHIYAHNGAYELDLAASEFGGYKIDLENNILSINKNGKWYNIYFGASSISENKLNRIFSAANNIMGKYDWRLEVDLDKNVEPVLNKDGFLKKYRFNIAQANNAWRISCIRFPKRGSLEDCSKRLLSLSKDIEELNSLLAEIPVMEHQIAIGYKMR